MSKFMLFLRHAVALIREDKLFSAIYIAGTAVAIASAMVIAIFLNIKLADIPPETNRSRTLYPLYGFFTKSLAENGREFDMRYSTAALDSCFRQLKCVEAATGVRSAFLSVTNEQQLWTDVYALCTDPSFFHLYDFTFISGRPFSEKEFRQGERVCIVTDKLAKRLNGATHVSISGSKGQFPFRVVGVVKAVSTLMEDATADIYIPYTVEVNKDDNPDQNLDQISYSGQLDVRFLLREGYSRKDFLDEIEPMCKNYNAANNVRLGKDWGEWKIDADTHFFKRLNFFRHTGDQDFSMKAKELMPPALLMLLFLLLPAINLSGLVSNRMEARRAEMGIRKAFGAKRRTLLNEVVHENFVLTLLGGIVGWLLSWLFITAVSNTDVIQKFSSFSQVGNEPNLDFRMFFTPTLFFVAFACCAVLNLMAALIPAWHSLRKPIVESLNQKR